MTRARQRNLLFLVSISGAVLAVVSAVYFSYQQARAESVARMERGANIWNDAMGMVLNGAKESLAKAAGQLRGLSPSQECEVLRQLAFDRPLFREAGVIRNGKLECTSFSVVDPPVAVWEGEHADVPPPGEIHIMPPTKTLLGGPSLVVNYRLDQDSVVNVLIAPNSILIPLGYIGRHFDHAEYLMRADGKILLSSSGAEAIAPAPSKVPPPGLGERSGELMYCRKVEGYDLSIVTIMPRGAMMKRWREKMPLSGLIGLATAGLFLLGGWRLERRLGQPDVEIRRGIEKGQIEAFLQPVVDLSTGRCCGAEALVRWQHPERGLVPPALFIPEAEAAGLITPLTLAVMASVVESVAPLLAERPDLHININISSRSLEEHDFCRKSLQILNGTIKAGQICLEITESAAMGREAKGRLEEFKRHGIKLAVDDFGTGYSNLRYLMDYPFDYLKIDKAFVDGIGSDGLSSGLVDHIIQIGKSCHLPMVAEGIEHASQAEYLHRAGVEFGQGYHFARPMPAGEFRDWLEAQA